MEEDPGLVGVLDPLHGVQEEGRPLVGQLATQEGRVGGGGGGDKKGVTNVRLQTEVYILHPPPLEGGGECTF